MKSNPRLFRAMFWIGFALWIAETWWFGWNLTPSCTAERVCDWISLLAMAFGCGFGYFGRDGSKESEKTCEWKYDDNGVYFTTCKNAFSFESDGPKENEFAFCPYCGNRLVAKAGQQP